ncbi:MAG: chorismate mutase [Cellulomonadaceae bacterium]|jgi:chorismate mutase|nr:chorismate mutase [Cellulomonadaceae bacterium]
MSEQEIPDDIHQLRRTIDNIDAALVHLLAERFKATHRVGEIKAVVSLPPQDPERERLQMARLTQIAKESGLDPAFADQFRAFVTAEVIRHHRLIGDQAGRTQS